MHFCRRCSRLFLRHAVSCNNGESVPSYLAVILRGATLYELVRIAFTVGGFCPSARRPITNLVNDHTRVKGTMVAIIFAYYILATIVPVDKIIGVFIRFSGFLFSCRWDY